MTQIKMAQIHWEALMSRFWPEILMRGDLRRYAIDRWWNSCEAMMNVPAEGKE